MFTMRWLASESISNLLPHSKADEIIQEGKGQHFDPEMVDAFLEIAEDFRQIALEFAAFDEERKALLSSDLLT